MSGVRVGSRLDRLLDLRRQVDVNIELERRAGNRPTPGLVASEVTPALPRQEAPPAPLVRIDVRSVKVDVIRDWAVTNGYGADVAARGRIPQLVLEEFEAAHR